MQVQSQEKPYDDINITPMLDLAYVLLVIFILMCTASVAGTRVNLPTGGKSAASKPPAVKPHVITIDNAGSVALDGAPVTSLEELAQRLADAKTQAPDFPVVIRGDSATKYQSIISVLEVVNNAGLTQVGLPTKATGSR